MSFWQGVIEGAIVSVILCIAVVLLLGAFAGFDFSHELGEATVTLNGGRTFRGKVTVYERTVKVSTSTQTTKLAKKTVARIDLAGAGLEKP
jgi:ABC-type xylose transport system permease subunit